MPKRPVYLDELVQSPDFLRAVDWLHQQTYKTGICQLCGYDNKPPKDSKALKAAKDEIARLQKHCRAVDEKMAVLEQQLRNVKRTAKEAELELKTVTGELDRKVKDAATLGRKLAKLEAAVVKVVLDVAANKRAVPSTVRDLVDVDLIGEALTDAG